MSDLYNSIEIPAMEYFFSESLKVKPNNFTVKMSPPRLSC